MKKKVVEIDNSNINLNKLISVFCEDGSIF